ncbi:exonuclease domain-containing protein [Pseudoteredinibacter isoporae]|uniref:DNA polymerase-3 subunit epsilon n=1 Tax=Pseudoteredinibacter isoporae TaxID=570281 RepID=A0A7X0JW82_9GAMM|nr:exonuclease domain-containing protein [Pseudoteredinibacter isoporae]MBB6522426.1 DNA polymerase-3 subunit epsilon [Pseudoteredinibacter isoporae]NHO87956.1 3'-5' exonuclease [Pseudoteredinibacter isoporae]NIB23713.1 3'-5' exonuclease [Pseudoteredinibacter isoporae]
MFQWLNRLSLGRGQEDWFVKALNKDFRELEFLALDLELTSLDPQSGDILSIGYVPIIEGFICPGEGRHCLISEHSGVGDSAIIHGIRDCDTDDGHTMEEALAELHQARQGRVLLLHHASLDLAFLAKHDNSYSSLLAVDTMRIEYQRRNRQGQAVANSLRLNQCRERYHLPTYKAHNALTDALATAELFLAQMSYMGGEERMSLGEVLSLSR